MLLKPCVDEFADDFRKVDRSYSRVWQGFCDPIRAGLDEGELKEGDVAEERLVEEMRLLGREALRVCAESRVEPTERDKRRLGRLLESPRPTQPRCRQ